MIIKNAKVYMPDFHFRDADVRIYDGKIKSVTEKGFSCESPDMAEISADEPVFDGTGMYLVPGLTDTHFHGCMGADFCDGSMQALETISAYEARAGVTQIVPATMTYPSGKLLSICQEAGTFKKNQQKRAEELPGALAVFCGIHLEGPFLAAEKKGAQNAAYLQKPDADLFERLQEESGNLIKLITLAPELSGAMEFIRRERGKVVISIGHSAADYEICKEAIRVGARHFTHFYNAMPAMSHREPGIIGAAMDEDDTQVELICDGVHVHPATVRNTFRVFSDDRILFVSDSMRAAGLQDGNYELGGQPVKVQGNKALLADGTIAGSVTNLTECMRIAVKQMDIPLETAVKCAAYNPAKCVGIEKDYGSIEPGKAANLMLLSQKDLSTVQVFLKGEPVLQL